MVVIPQGLMETLSYNQKVEAGEKGRHVLNVDKEMGQVMTRKDLSESDKIRLYNNALLKFGDTKPLPRPTVSSREQVEQEVVDEWLDTIDRHFGLQHKNKAKNVLSWIRGKSNISWNDKGEINGIPGSNILTLLDDITRQTPRDKNVEPIGMHDFATKLLDSNIPRYLISNHYQKYFKPTTPFSTPLTTKKKRVVSPYLNRSVPTPPTTPPQKWLTP